eukprot:3553007-Rhodomonas_salina.1
MVPAVATDRDRCSSASQQTPRRAADHPTPFIFDDNFAGMQPPPIHDGALCQQISTGEFHPSHLQALCKCHLLCQDLYLFTDLVEAQSPQILATRAPIASPDTP